MKLGCVIMASGEGKRFGSNKMLADIYGEPLIARTIDSVPRGFDVVVSTRWPEVAQICEDKHCPCVLHDGELRSQSIKAGLSWGAERNWKGCLFLPGDQPLVSLDSFEAMVRAFDERGRKHPARLACNGEPSSPVLFRRNCSMRSYVLRARTAAVRSSRTVPMWCWSRRVPTSCGTSIPPRGSNA